VRSSFWTGLGVVLTAAMVVLSALINYNFGYSLGTTETNGRIFGAVSVVAVGVMAVLPLRITAQWNQRCRGRAVLGAGVFGILVAYAIASSIGFGMQNRSQLAGSRENLNAQLEDAIQDRDLAVKRLQGLEQHALADAVRRKIDAAKKDRRWDITQGCTDATAQSSREFCQGIDRLQAELGVASTAAVLTEKIDKLNLTIENLRKQGAGQTADPQSLGFSVVFGVGEDRVRAGLSILMALVIESVCCLGLLVIVGSHAAGVSAGDRVTLPEWIGRWLTERAEPQPAVRTSFAVLEADFREWGRAREAPRLGSWRFRRLLRAACKEVGLPVRRRAVVGLHLAPVPRMLTVE
jgi:hypothetical protein